jgi:hypothetical protein
VSETAWHYAAAEINMEPGVAHVSGHPLGSYKLKGVAVRSSAAWLSTADITVNAAIVTHQDLQCSGRHLL